MKDDYKSEKTAEDRLKMYKCMVEAWGKYFRENNRRFWDFTKFVCATNLSNDDLSMLQTLQKPPLQFNVLESLVSRLRSEFVKQEPSVTVRTADGLSGSKITPDLIETMEVVEGYLRAIFNEATNDNLQAQLNTDCLVGGFSAAFITTEYTNEFSFEQKIVIERVFDPTMTFFDPLARTSHKGDGSYCGMLIPYTKERVIDEFGESACRDIDFSSQGHLNQFNWSYKNEEHDIVLVAQMFKKGRKRMRLVLLSDGQTMTKDEYKEALENWAFIEQPPVILDERWSHVEYIEEIKFCEKKIFSRYVTDYKYLPIIFIDGNSILIKGSAETSSSDGGAVQQMTRPLVYHAVGAQKLMNFSGQTIAAEIENMVMHKFVVALEAIPDKYTEAYTNVQEANVLVYNAFDKNTGTPLQPPREIQRTPTPPIVESTFMNSETVIRAALGITDAMQREPGDETSGRAIMQSAMQSGASAGPYLTNYIKFLDRVGLIVADLIPKYYVTPRSIPFVARDGKRSFRLINDTGMEGSVDMHYDSTMLQIKVEAGVNSSVEKQLSLEYLLKLMSAVPEFAEFMNARGMGAILDNLEIRNVEQLRMLYAEYEQEMQQAAEEAKGQPTPEEMQLQTISDIEMAKIQQRAVRDEQDLMIRSAEVAIDKQKADIEEFKAVAQAEERGARVEIEAEQLASENARDAVKLTMEAVEEASSEPARTTDEILF